MIILASAALTALGLGTVDVTGAIMSDRQAVDSNTLATTTVSAPVLVSLAPGCSPSGKVRVIVDWTAPTSGAAPDGYEIYRSKTTNTNYSLIARVSSDTTVHTDGGVQHSLTYWYKLLSTRGSWTSPFSNELSALTPDLCL